MLKAIKSILGGSTNDVAAELSAAELKLSQAKSDQARLAAERENVLLHGSDEDLDKHDREIIIVDRTIQRSDALVRKLQGELDAARKADAEAARRARYERAQDVLKTAPKLAAKYAEAEKLIYGILRQIAEGEVAIEAANCDLPLGEDRLPGVESKIRGIEPRFISEETGRRLVEKWAYLSSGEMVHPDHQSLVHRNKDGDHVLDMGSYKHPVHLREFEEVTIAKRDGRSCGRLADVLVLPGFYPDQIGFQPPLAGAHSGARLLEKLNAIDEARANRSPKPPAAPTVETKYTAKPGPWPPEFMNLDKRPTSAAVEPQDIPLPGSQRFFNDVASTY